MSTADDQAERLKQLETENRRLVAMLDSLDDHVILFDPSARVLFLNRATEAVAARHLRAPAGRDDRDEHRGGLAVARAQGLHPRPDRARVRRRDGRAGVLAPDAERRDLARASLQPGLRPRWRGGSRGDLEPRDPRAQAGRGPPAPAVEDRPARRDDRPRRHAGARGRPGGARARRLVGASRSCKTAAARVRDGRASRSRRGGGGGARAGRTRLAPRRVDAVDLVARTYRIGAGDEAPARAESRAARGADAARGAVGRSWCRSS